jgi:hypothetical protein
MTSCGFTKLTAFRGRQCANYEGSAGYWLGDRPAARGDQTTLRRTGSAWQKVCYAALPPMSPTIAPNAAQEVTLVTRNAFGNDRATTDGRYPRLA